MERLKSREHAIDILEKVFIGRKDDHAQMLPDGRYMRMFTPISRLLLTAHIRGEITIASYVLDEHDMAKFTVLDADDDVEYYKLFKAANELASDGVYMYIEQSRRGGHGWFHHEESISGKDAKDFGEGIAAEYGLNVEVFPKQDETNGGVGSAIRVPFGIHRKSGKRYPFVRRYDGMLIAPTVEQQLIKLQYPNRVGKETVERYSKLVPPPPEQPVGEAHVQSDEERNSIWERIRRAKPVYEFVENYVELKPTLKGGVGHCPFHEDEIESFSVNADMNYWKCFAGCGGGGIIEFYMKMKDVELGIAVRDLKQILEVDDG